MVPRAPFAFIVLVSCALAPVANGVGTVTSIWGGAREVIALKSDGSVWTWGSNASGELGNGNTTNQAVPIEVVGPDGRGHLSAIIAIAGGEMHNVALTSDGRLWAWGENGFGQLGNGNRIGSRHPLPVVGLSSVVSVNSRAYHTLAIRSDGTVWGWGWNCHGALGDTGSRFVTLPVQIKGLNNPIMVGAGYCFGIALLQDHTVVAWGRATQLGNGTTVDNPTPIAVPGLADIVSISAGWEHAMAVKSDGTVWTWGLNDWRGRYGKLGNGTQADQLSPAPVAGMTGVVQASAGDDFSAVLKSDGTVWTFGANDVGQLGNGDPNFAQQLSPVEVIGLASVTYIIARDFHAAAIKSDGSVWSWGSGAQGELGVRCTPLSVPEQFQLTGSARGQPKPPFCINRNVPVQIQWP